MIIKRHQAIAFKDNVTLFLSNINKVYTLNTETFVKNEIFRFRTDLFSIMSSFSSILRRLLRKDTRFALKIDDEYLILIKDKCIYKIDFKSSKLVSCVMLPRGSRPLNMTIVDSLNGFNDGIYFGEYFENPLKTSVKVLQYTNDDNFRVVYEFPDGAINHIHNLVVDKYRECIWLLTGDTEDSAGIYQITNNFKTVTKVACGKQEYRACVLFPLENGLLYATDSQFQLNSIRFLCQKQNGWESKHVFDINGPCIYGTKIEDNFYFSTSVEGLNSGNIIKKLLRNKPGPGIKNNQSEIICGNLQKGFKTIYSDKKDIFPYILFQFGNIFFPSGYNASKKLFFTSVALKKNDFSTKIMDYEV